MLQTMFRTYVYLLFLVPGTLLDLVGYDYSSIGGSQITKIHVSTYFVVPFAIVFLVTYPHKQALMRYYAAEKPGSLFFFVVATTALINIILGKRNGFGMYFDTDLNLFLCSMLLPFVMPTNLERLEKFVHIYFAANAALAIFEFVTGWHPFPLTTYSPDGYAFEEPRATAFLGHPLFGATMTCVYVISLLSGTGSFNSAWLPGMLSLQILALIAFGGRSAFGLTMSIIGAVLLLRTLRFVSGSKLLYRQIIMGAFACVATVFILIGALYSGTLDPFIERFEDDGGSARTRLLMWPLLTSFKWGDMLWGAPTDYVFSQIVFHGLAWGIENPFMQIAVYQGVVVATMITIGIALTLYEIYKRLERKCLFAIAAFLLLSSGFGSFAGRYYTVSQFIVTIEILYRRRSTERVTSSR